MGEAPQRNVGGGTGEPFRAGELNGRHAQAFDIPRMTNRSHGDAIVNLEQFLPCPSQSKKQNSIPITESDDRAAGRELGLDVLAAVRDRLDPAIRLFDHATLRLKRAAIRFSGKVLIPSRETILITGNIFAFRSTPPVAVSDSAAVSSARNATVTASSSFN